MKILRTVQKNYAILGISPSNKSNKIYPFSIRIILGLLFFGCLFVLQLVYFFYEASNFMEYMECIGSIYATVALTVCLLATVYRNAKLFESIVSTEKLIDTSKFALNLLFMI